ncbi:MAG: hypothetical protein R3E08_14320 [Thiotrichaceae bacterium]
MNILLNLTAKPRQSALVSGARDAGDMLVRDILRNPKSDYTSVGFLDDQQRLQGGKLQGVSVLAGWKTTRDGEIITS